MLLTLHKQSTYKTDKRRLHIASHFSAEPPLLVAALAMPSPFARDAGVRTLTAPEPEVFRVKGLLVVVVVLGLLEGSVLKDAAVRRGEGGRRAKTCIAFVGVKGNATSPPRPKALRGKKEAWRQRWMVRIIPKAWNDIFSA